MDNQNPVSSFNPISHDLGEGTELGKPAQEGLWVRINPQKEHRSRVMQEAPSTPIATVGKFPRSK
jgi:hypothetical protein